MNCFRALNEADILECENLASGEDGDKALTIVDVVTHPEDEKGAVSLPSGTTVSETYIGSYHLHDIKEVKSSTVTKVIKITIVQFYESHYH